MSRKCFTEREVKMRATFLGGIAVVASVVAMIVSPPAITMYQNNGFFWWGFLPGLFFALGIVAIIFANTND